MSHTPGPWQWVGSYLESVKTTILAVNPEEYGWPDEADEALIAAAPDLLAASQAMVESFYGENHDDDLLPEACRGCGEATVGERTVNGHTAACLVGPLAAAIAKAKGA